MVAYNTRIPSGVPGAVSRLEMLTAEAQMLDPAVPVPGYGLPIKLGTNGRIQPIGAGDAATAVYGFLIRPFPGFANAASIVLGTDVPPTVGIAHDVMRRGYMQVVLGGTTPATKNGPVFVRIAAAATGKPIGGIEAAADSANTIQVAGCTFMGASDAQGNTEISFNI